MPSKDNLSATVKTYETSDQARNPQNSPPTSVKRSNSETDKTESHLSPVKKARGNQIFDNPKSTTSTSNLYNITDSIRFSTENTDDYTEEMPYKSSDWDEHIFPALNIRTDHTSSELDTVFTSGYCAFLKDNRKTPVHEVVLAINRTREANSKSLAKVKCCINAVTIDYEKIYSIPKQKVLSLLKDSEKDFLETKFYKEWLQKKLTWQTDDMKHYMTNVCTKLNTRIADFYQQLWYMNSRDNDQGEILKGMFQELFICFVKMFDLKIVGVPNLQSYVLKIGEYCSTLLPDALIIRPETNKVVAVVEVRKSYSKTSDSSCERTLKSKHLGEMLAVLSSSEFGLNGVFGIIVQGTEVTLASLEVDTKYSETLQDGNLKKIFGSVQYSKPYNFLTQDGRQKLCQIFVDIATLLNVLN